MKNQETTLSLDGALELDVSAVNGTGTSNAVKSGDPGVAGGTIPFVAHTDEDAGGLATVFTRGVFNVAVRGHDGTADAAVAVGETLFWDNTNEELDVATGGEEFGIALDAVAAGATTTIRVLLA